MGRRSNQAGHAALHVAPIDCTHAPAPGTANTPVLHYMRPTARPTPTDRDAPCGGFHDHANGSVSRGHHARQDPGPGDGGQHLEPALKMKMGTRTRRPGPTAAMVSLLWLLGIEEEEARLDPVDASVAGEEDSGRSGGGMTRDAMDRRRAADRVTGRGGAQGRIGAP